MGAGRGGRGIASPFFQRAATAESVASVTGGVTCRRALSDPGEDVAELLQLFQQQR